MRKCKNCGSWSILKIVENEKEYCERCYKGEFRELVEAMLDHYLETIGKPECKNEIKNARHILVEN